MGHTVRNARTRVDTVLIKMYVTIPTDHVLTVVKMVSKAYYVKHVSRSLPMPAQNKITND